MHQGLGLTIVADGDGQIDVPREAELDRRRIERSELLASRRREPVEPTETPEAPR